jgi:hypothetical protein
LERRSLVAAREAKVLGFTGAYLAAAAVGAFVSGNAEFLYYIAVVLLLAGGVIAVHLRARFPAALLWCLSLWGAAHMAGGLVPVREGQVLYNLWLLPGRLKYDQLVHALGFGVTTWACWEALRRALADPRPRTGPLVLCAAAGMGFGALNEVVEFVAVLVLPETNVGGYENTGWDLVSNLVGAIAAAAAIRCLDRRAYWAREGASRGRTSRSK